MIEEQSPPPEAALAAGPPPTVTLAEPVALRGVVLAPGGAIEDGYVVVDGNQIEAVEETRPEGVRVHETKGVITPGLIDLHGHPEFNIFAAWEPPKQFINRYAWRGSDLYQRLVRDPQNHLLDVLPPKTQLRYAEIRALVGGVTAIQGTGGQASGFQDEALVRNVDKWIFGSQVGRALIDLPTPGSEFGMDSLRSILAGIDAGEVGAFYVHLAEGRSDNELSRNEFAKLVALNALTPATVVIHGTALVKDAARRAQGRRGEAGLVAAVEPAPIRGDNAGGRRPRARPADRPRCRLAAERQHQPLGGDEGRASLYRRAARARADPEAAGRHGHPRRGDDRRARGEARSPRKGPARRPRRL